MKDFFRPNMVVLTNCKKVLLQERYGTKFASLVPAYLITVKT
jgi:hypothetical protein